MGCLSPKYEREQMWPFIVLALFTCIYLFLPSNNCSGDALCYAADVRYGNNLFHPHHLLHTAFGYTIYQFLRLFLDVDSLHMMAFVNGVFAGGCLLALYKTLRLRHRDSISLPMAVTLLAGSSFGFMRFSVEGEAYVIPLFWTLLASFSYCKYLEKNSLIGVLWVSLFASVACLFHQVQVFWGIALFMGILVVNRKHALLYAATCIVIVVSVYMLIIVEYEGKDFSFGTFVHYVSSYYHTDKGHLSVSMVNLMMTPISLVRTFIQSHGNIMMLFGHAKIFVVVGLIGLVLLLVLTVFSYKFCKLRSPRSITGNVLFEYVHLLAFVLQFIFAFISDGNAEFMVMLPFLMAIFLPLFIEVRNSIPIWLGTLGLLIWNLSVAIVPQHVLNYFNHQEVVRIVNEKGNCRYFSSDYQVLVNQNYYDTGIDEDPRFLSNKDFYVSVDSIKQMGLPVYVDKAFPVPFSRQVMLKKDADETITITRLPHKKAAEINCAFGCYEIWQY